jgi:hypothetical protein
MIDQDRAMGDAREAADPTPADRLIERLAELIGAKAGVRAVFGEPVQQGRVTVIPVARVRWGVSVAAEAAQRPRQTARRRAREEAAASPRTRSAMSRSG